MSNIIKIVGIDPSMRNLGLALGHYDLTTQKLDIVKVCLVQTESNRGEKKVVRQTSDDRRCFRELYLGLHGFMRENGVTLATGEVPSCGGRSARATYGFGAGTMLMSTVAHLIEVSPEEVKLAAVNDKNATKSQMIEWAVSHWPNAGWLTQMRKGKVCLLNDNEHMADACAAVVAGTRTAQFQQATMMMASLKAA